MEKFEGLQKFGERAHLADIQARQERPRPGLGAGADAVFEQGLAQLGAHRPQRVE